MWKSEGEKQDLLGNSSAHLVHGVVERKPVVKDPQKSSDKNNVHTWRLCARALSCRLARICRATPRNLASRRHKHPLQAQTAFAHPRAHYTVCPLELRWPYPSAPAPALRSATGETRPSRLSPTTRAFGRPPPPMFSRFPRPVSPFPKT